MLRHMGRLSDKQQEIEQRLREAIVHAVPPGETIRGVVIGNQQRTFSVSLWALGVTEQHLVLQPLDRKYVPNGTPIALRADEIEVGNIFGDGAGLSIGKKAQELRFSARGEKYKFMTLGGNMLENLFASDGQLDGLDAIVEFLRSAKR